MYYLIAYLIIFGTIATLNYHAYRGYVPYTSCIMAALFFPLQLTNYLVSFFLGFFGVLWNLKISFLITPEQLEKYEKNDDDHV